MPSDNNCLLCLHKVGLVPWTSERIHMYSLGGKNKKGTSFMYSYDLAKL